MLEAVSVEYVWLDSLSQLRSKSRILLWNPDEEKFSVDGKLTENIPDWSFDGSSTDQALSGFSDIILRPVRMIEDPFGMGYIALCELYSVPEKELFQIFEKLAVGSSEDILEFAKVSELAPACNDSRVALRRTMISVNILETHINKSVSPIIGFEQEYVLISKLTGRALGWPKDGFPAPQGNYYCGNGAEKAFGREIATKHLEACIRSKLFISGINAGIAPGQWEYQIGASDPLTISDHLWLSRFLLIREAEKRDVMVSFDPNPVQGNWNGSGLRINFSTSEMREEDGLSKIIEGCKKLSTKVDKHLKVYGKGCEDRIADAFDFNVGDRNTDVRIPLQVALEGKGYLQDRRPCANVDPYEVSKVMIETIVLAKME